MAVRNAEHSTSNFRKMDDVARTLGMNPDAIEKARWLLEGPKGARLPRTLVRSFVKIVAALAMRKLHRPSVINTGTSMRRASILASIMSKGVCSPTEANRRIRPTPSCTTSHLDVLARVFRW